ncbi:hypothetical protein HBB16_18160 [Pseudonocardia sp. MCCB 268]|nr:hypothetical protein [Pseudonocardia cytotoxica]
MVWLAVEDRLVAAPSTRPVTPAAPTTPRELSVPGLAGAARPAGHRPRRTGARRGPAASRARDRPGRRRGDRGRPQAPAGTSRTGPARCCARCSTGSNGAARPRQADELADELQRSAGSSAGPATSSVAGWSGSSRTPPQAAWSPCGTGCRVPATEAWPPGAPPGGLSRPGPDGPAWNCWNGSRAIARGVCPSVLRDRVRLCRAGGLIADLPGGAAGAGRGPAPRLGRSSRGSTTWPRRRCGLLAARPRRSCCAAGAQCGPAVSQVEDPGSADAGALRGRKRFAIDAERLDAPRRHRRAHRHRHRARSRWTAGSERLGPLVGAGDDGGWDVTGAQAVPPRAAASRYCRRCSTTPAARAGPGARRRAVAGRWPLAAAAGGRVGGRGQRVPPAGRGDGRGPGRGDRLRSQDGPAARTVAVACAAAGDQCCSRPRTGPVETGPAGVAPRQRGPRPSWQGGRHRRGRDGGSAVLSAGFLLPGPRLRSRCGRGCEGRRHRRAAGARSGCCSARWAATVVIATDAGADHEVLLVALGIPGLTLGDPAEAPVALPFWFARAAWIAVAAAAPGHRRHRARAQAAEAAVRPRRLAVTLVAALAGNAVCALHAVLTAATGAGRWRGVRLAPGSQWPPEFLPLPAGWAGWTACCTARSRPVQRPGGGVTALSRASTAEGSRPRQVAEGVGAGAGASVLPADRVPAVAGPHVRHSRRAGRTGGRHRAGAGRGRQGRRGLGRLAVDRRPRKDCWASGAPCLPDIAAGLGVVLHADRSAINWNASCGRRWPTGERIRGGRSGTPSPRWTPSGAGSKSGTCTTAPRTTSSPLGNSARPGGAPGPPGEREQAGPPRRAARGRST